MKLYEIDTGYFKLDGGAMFGVVPKQMWNRINPADNNNMCTWAMRCLLLVTDTQKILIDTGMGDKQDEKFRQHFEPHGESSLIQSIRAQGFHEDEITDVIITHLHFDHVGGAVTKDQNGHFVPQFKEAVYWSNKVHYDWAMDPNPREKASFLKENFVPLMDEGRLKFIDIEDGVAFNDRINFSFVYGHTEAMMIPEIKLDDGRTMVYIADLLPSAGHVRMPYVMSYDIRPLVTLEERKRHYAQYNNTETIIFFEHDKDHQIGQLIKNEKGRYAIDTAVDFEFD